ncbi:transcriptional regulator, LacI family [Formosa agariphila KMM 3901]|uniref:Transcriptional regulator, LacI family n=1 Tax=Formosa agariphila (strain DSM 15362 / KCTC 12365 / LMG 23005 / KMM 3901 / M-2Alg 35-1) TaxID=1347342 RepID=T2KHV5_FORAG|nr:LacI family DNA-binding transcriptional regulator [Formosa agariphila]CDF78432.1 transcriptional regulator, LacI family [Formosa agariphila KMM 3901]
MKKTTLKDIAKALNVSVSTVSKALHDIPEISEETRILIQNYAKEKNYRPNYNALSLKNKRTKSIGVIIPNMLNYFYMQVLQGIEKEAAKNGYRIMTCISNESYQKEVEIIDMLSTGSIDGFLLAISKETEANGEISHFTDTVKFGFPIVMFDRVSDQVECDKIINDDLNATADAVSYLVNQGCKRIAFVSPLKKLSKGRIRFEGYKKGLEQNNLPFNPDLIINESEADYKKYANMIRPLFDHKIDGILSTNESSAVSAMKLANENGYSIPSDLAVISFSNGLLARHSNPKLTCVSQHGEIMGAAAVKKLIEKLEQKKEENKPFTTELVETDIVVRDSTR